MSVLDGYSPQGMSEDDWTAVVGPVSELLEGAPPSLAARARRGAAMFALFVHRQGHTVTADLLCQPSLLSLWTQTLPNPRTAATYRSVLRKLAALRRPQLAAERQPLGRPSDCPPPYTDVEVAQMLTHAAAVATPHRRADAAALVLLGAGAGLDGRDLAELTPDRVVRRDDGLVTVEVTGSRRARTVAVLRRYAAPLAKLAEEQAALHPGRWLAGASPGNRSRTERATRQFHGWGGPPVSARRLRITWLATHLRAGTGLAALRHQAGTDTLRVLDEVAAHIVDELDDTAVWYEAAGALR